jgi:serine protease Do
MENGGGGGRWFVAGCFLVGCLLPQSAGAFQSLRSDLRKNGSVTMRAFEPLRAVLQQSSAVVYDGRKPVAYGTVVDAGGWIVTKASEIAGRKKLVVRVGARKFSSVEVAATDDRWDVALLKIDAVDLVPVRWSEAGEPKQGTWVVTNGATTRSKRRALAGIISANARALPATGGVALGVVLDAGTAKAKISEVVKKSGAEKAGVKAGDVIVALDGKKVGKREELIKLLEARKPGDRVRLRCLRQGKEIELDVELMPKEGMFEGPKSRQDKMSGRFSKRRSGFPRVIQHEILGDRTTVGGPLIDLSGRCVGVNIAQANRAESFAIPAREMRELVARLRKKATGK